MNLLATEESADILQSLKLVLVVPPSVSQEAIYIEGIEAGSARLQIDLTPLEKAGLLVNASLSDEEADLTVELARLVDDGEAEVIAVGLCRRLVVATDDRKARRLAIERGADLLSTPEILQRWHVVAEISDERIVRAVALVSRRSRYIPPQSHELRDWWMALLEKSVGN